MATMALAVPGKVQGQGTSSRYYIRMAENQIHPTSASAFLILPGRLIENAITAIETYAHMEYNG